MKRGDRYICISSVDRDRHDLQSFHTRFGLFETGRPQGKLLNVSFRSRKWYEVQRNDRS